MSAGNAAAIRRRVGANTSAPSTISKPTPPSPPEQKGLTLPQVISNLDKRIKDLESGTSTSNGVHGIFSPDILEEFNSRFEILANELSDIKDSIIKLQSFTMEVNKTLYDERIQILSDVGSQSVVTNNTDFKEPSSPTSVDIKNLAQEELSNTE